MLDILDQKILSGNLLLRQTSRGVFFHSPGAKVGDGGEGMDSGSFGELLGQVDVMFMSRVSTVE